MRKLHRVMYSMASSALEPQLPSTRWCLETGLLSIHLLLLTELQNSCIVREADYTRGKILTQPPKTFGNQSLEAAPSKGPDQRYQISERGWRSAPFTWERRFHLIESPKEHHPERKLCPQARHRWANEEPLVMSRLFHGVTCLRPPWAKLLGKAYKWSLYYVNTIASSPMVKRKKPPKVDPEFWEEVFHK